MFPCNGGCVDSLTLIMALSPASYTQATKQVLPLEGVESLKGRAYRWAPKQTIQNGRQRPLRRGSGKTQNSF